MSILAGGVWCDGAFNRHMLLGSPGPSNAFLNQWARLIPDPNGRPYHVLRTYISHSDYVAAPGDSTKRAEMASASDVAQWEEVQTMHWRIVVPPDMPFWSADQSYSIAQMHDVDNAGIPRRPSMHCEIRGTTLYWEMSADAYASGRIIYSYTFVPGEELEFTLRVRWVDGSHDTASNGFVMLWHGDRLVYNEAGLINTWIDGTGTSEPNPPYLKAGIYQPNTSATWWAGREFWMYHVASIVASAEETPVSLRAYVDGRLSANSNLPRPVYVPAGM